MLLEMSHHFYLLDAKCKCDYKRQTNENTIVRVQVSAKKESERETPAEKSDVKRTENSNRQLNND